MSAADAFQHVAAANTGVRGRWLRPAPVVGAAAVVAAGGAAVVVTGDVLVHSTWFALFGAYNVLAYVAAALLWLHLRPRSAAGPMLLVFAGALAIQLLQGASSSVPFSIGVLIDPVAVLIAFYLLLAFPRVRLTRAGGLVFGIGVAGIMVGFVPWFFLSPHVAGGTFLARCTAACPVNAFMLLDRPTVAAHFGTVDQIFILAFCVAFIAFVGARLARATPPQRRVVAPTYVVGGFWIVVFGAFHALQLGHYSNLRTYTYLGWVLTGARVALPLAFVLAFAFARLSAGRALGTMLQRVGTRPSAPELERAARDALGDPGLTLVLPGETAVREAQVGRASRVLRSDGHEVAELRYDAGLDENPELLDAVATAVLLSVERGAIVFELQRSERRAAAAGDAERRRLERNLHDSAQQRLVALRMRMGMAQERLAAHPTEVAAELGLLEHEVDTVLDEIRTIARGTYPPILREEGLGEAVADVVRAHPRARMGDRSTVHRHPQEIEAAVYFSTLEALQNASKHSGADSGIVVSLWEEPGELHFEVLDDGLGFDPADTPGGGGLDGVAERLRAFDGELTVRSAPSHGTRVGGFVRI